MPRSTDPDARLFDVRRRESSVVPMKVGLSRAVFVFLSHQQARDGVPWVGHGGGAWFCSPKYLNRSPVRWGQMTGHMRLWQMRDGPKALWTTFHFWIDICCADDACLENEGPFMAALPAYIAACHAIATDWVEEYSPTATEEHYHSPGDDWRKAEVMLAFAFSMTGYNRYLIPRDFDQTMMPNRNSVSAYEAMTQISSRAVGTRRGILVCARPERHHGESGSFDARRDGARFEAVHLPIRAARATALVHTSGAASAVYVVAYIDNICCCGQWFGLCALFTSRNLPPSACTKEALVCIKCGSMLGSALAGIYPVDPAFAGKQTGRPMAAGGPIDRPAFARAGLPQQQAVMLLGEQPGARRRSRAEQRASPRQWLQSSAQAAA